jgi:hypothetical protein
MRWPSADDCKRISDVWQRAYGSGVSAGESDNARSKLRQLQRKHALTETELAYVAECTQKEPTKSKISPTEVERPPNLLDMILFLLEDKRFHLGRNSRRPGLRRNRARRRLSR